MVAAAGVPVRARSAAALRQHAAAARRRLAGARRRARGICHGQVLRRRSSSASRARPRLRMRTMRAARADRLSCGSRSDAFVLGLFPSQVVACLSMVARQLGLAALPMSAAPWWMLVPIRRTPDELRATGVPGGDPDRRRAEHRRASGVFYHRRVRRGAAWDCGFARPRTRACRTRRRASASRFVTSSSRSSPCNANCRRRSTARRGIALTIGDRIWLGLLSAAGAHRAAVRRGSRRLAAAGTHRGLSALQLRHARSAAGARAMNAAARLDRAGRSKCLPRSPRRRCSSAG